ncbi:MAG: DUF3990 domain-containing protein [archaeon]|nr:DUF3990 domain-containing protein [archaeon]
MKDLLREIRSRTGLSQKAFGDRLNVSFATVNRWENGHSLPLPAVQQQIVNLCEDLSLPLADIVIDHHRSSYPTILYHGSKGGIDGDIKPISRSRCDFGRGFYLGSDPRQPLMLVAGNESARYYRMTMDTHSLHSVIFKPDIDWIMAVAFNRNRLCGYEDTEIYRKYSRCLLGADLAIGPIADDRLFYTLDEFFHNRITDAAAVACISTMNYGTQTVCLTEKACSQVKIQDCCTLSTLEHSVLSNEGDRFREEGRKRAEEIIKQHRRDGLYFDEILEGEQ